MNLKRYLAIYSALWKNSIARIFNWAEYDSPSPWGEGRDEGGLYSCQNFLDSILNWSYPVNSWKILNQAAVKTRINNLFLVLACTGLLTIQAAAQTQTFTTLHRFTESSAPYYTNSDGAQPIAGLILSGNTLYGTAYDAGGSGKGAVFAVNIDGTDFTNLHNFTGSSTDGAYPNAGLILSGDTLYGATADGGSSGKGAVFKININGIGFTNLYSFTATVGSNSTNSDGANPYGTLILSGNTLYGTASYGGISGDGTVFAVDTNGTTFTNLYSFKAVSGSNSTNSDGANPRASLVLSGNTMYGTTESGGSSGRGTVFAINTDGKGFTNLYSFTGGSVGSVPEAGLILSGNTLYGTVSGGGSSSQGTVFAINTDGTGYTNLYSFTATSGSNSTNSDGATPFAGLILSGSTLYGTAYLGGSFGYGTVFVVNTDGTDFTNLHNFSSGSDGAEPNASLILSGNTLYGTTFQGGGSGYVGTVFDIVLPSPPQLTIIASDANFIVTWPTNAAEFTLQSTTNLAPPAVWNTVSPAPIVVNGQNTVTNPITGAQQFFRLSHP